MELKIGEKEINTALRSVITDMGFNLTGKQLNVEYSVGRKKNKGLSAIVNITSGATLPAGFTDAEDDKPSDKVKAVVETTAADAASDEPATAASTVADEPEAAVAGDTEDNLFKD